MKSIFFFTLAVATLLSCEYVDEPNIESTVSGVVFDSTTQLPLSNFKLKVGEYDQRRAGLMLQPYFIQYLDSTYTDSNGYYSISFKTSGKGDYYQLEYELPDGYTMYDPDYYSRFYNEITLREINEINLLLQKTATLQARLIVRENSTPPLTVYHPLNTDKREKIFGFNNDTTLYMQVERNRRNTFLFTVDGDSYETHYEFLEVGDVALNDTIKHVFEIYPSEFD